MGPALYTVHLPSQVLTDIFSETVTTTKSRQKIIYREKGFMDGHVYLRNVPVQVLFIEKVGAVETWAVNLRNHLFCNLNVISST